MKLCVTCVYWTLLLISVVSSGVLFLIVASESTHSRHSSSIANEDDSADAYDNITLDGDGNENLDLSHILLAESQNLISLKKNQKKQYSQDESLVSASFETFASEEARKEKELEILAESLTQQPNLSQGISETGQAVVLTLVDTAAAELQSLTEPRISPDFRTRPKNSTVPSSAAASRSSEKVEEPTQSTQIPAPPLLDDTTERPNDTEHSDDEEEVVVLRKSIVGEDVPEVVVVVRAEQKVTDGGELRLENDAEPEEAEEEEDLGHVMEDVVPKMEDGFGTASELNDTAARARLAVAGNRDEAAAVILDGLVASGPTDPHEDIPSFSEWAQKRLEEAEKKKTHPNASVQNPGGPGGRGAGGMKVRSKNYASPDCGAKIVAVNPEARSAKSVLASTRDEYMLNTCTSRVWFVVELCEAIQAKKIELANFELFSSSPKDFSVFVSDRLPTRDWSPVGHFTAKDEKDIQSFNLHPHLFGKFIKVELHSHYGSEHFCPISLFRAYGTSEFEVLETETENQAAREASSDGESEDSDDEEVLDVESGEPPRNLFGSATDAVLSIVKKAAEVLVKSSDMSGNNITKIQQNIDGVNMLESSYDACVTPRYTILCANCSDERFAKVFQLVSCRDRQLDEMLKTSFVKGTLASGRLCRSHGVNVGAVEVEVSEESKMADRTHHEPWRERGNFLSSLLRPEYIIGLCNVLAAKERKVVMNTSYEVPGRNDSDPVVTKDAINAKTMEPGETITVHQSPETRTIDSTSTATKSSATIREPRRRGQEVAEETITTAQTTEAPSSSETLTSQIKPTKTLTKEDLKRESSIPDDNFHAEVLTTLPPSPSVATPTLKIAEEPSILGTSMETTPRTITSVPVVNSDSQEADSGVVSDTDSVELGRVDRETDQEMKEVKSKEFLEHEGKLAQDPIAFDSLLSDLKDLDSDAVNLQNGQANSASTTHPTASTTPQQKESVFLRLSNRIKALERNMSLSGQYLEELSRRYKKQVEEMQRSLERAVSAMGEESRKGEERETKRMEEIAALREKIASLSKSVESLLYDRDSWRTRVSAIGQHALLICLEVIIVIVILSYCRRAGDFEDEEEERSATKKELVRRKSVENYSGSATKKTKKRRPSEIASHISGSYRELMIDDKYETKKERKKKRKKEASLKVTLSDETKKEPGARFKGALTVPGPFPTRRASSVDAPSSVEFQTQSRPDSAPETTVGWFDDQTPSKERQRHGREFESRDKISELGRQTNELSESNSSSTTMDRSVGGSVEDSRSVGLKRAGYRSGILKTARLSSPSFMKTALGSRRRRKASSGDSERTEDVEGHSGQSSDRSRRESPTSQKSNANGGTTNGLLDESDESRSSSATPTSGKKEKRSTGLKKMVRKLF